MVGPACEKGLGQDQVTLLDEQEETSKVNVSHFVEHPQLSHTRVLGSILWKRELR